MNKEGTLKGGSRRYMMRAVEDSLKRLRTDWFDLYQLHQPDPLNSRQQISELIYRRGRIGR
jgi:aryl-alcohol dehydrogenase-like predicted oxidoreductase